MGWGELGLRDVRGVLHHRSVRVHIVGICQWMCAYLVGFVRSGGRSLALLTRGELGEVAVVVALPVSQMSAYQHHLNAELHHVVVYAHLVVEHLALTSLSLRNQAVVENVEDILTDVLELRLDLLAVVANDANVLVHTLGLLFLLDAGDDAP